MSSGPCPSCGAPVEFTAGTAAVLVCSHCQTVVARKDARLEAHGKVARIVESDTPFRLGTQGTYRGAAFTLVGHLQKDYGKGPWNEWYLTFDGDDERDGWLAEAEGNFYITFFAGTQEELPWSGQGPGSEVTLRGQRFTVEETGTARVLAAEGQLPSDVDPTQEVHYADATGPQGVFATLDFGTRDDTPELFVGHQVQLNELALVESTLPPRQKRVDLEQARCTECNGPLELRAPDRARRVGCPYCGALLDVSLGKLAFLEMLQKPAHPVRIPLGARGTLDGVAWICIGFFVRSCKVEGIRYPWAEYLLFNASQGFAWLVESDGHWNYLTSVAAGQVPSANNIGAQFRGRSYRCFQITTALTEYVLGECYWEVASQDTAQCTEWVAAPFVLSKEETPNEVSYSHGRYVEPAELVKAFGLREPLPEPRGIAPAQPNPHRERTKQWGRWSAGYAVVALLVYVVMVAMSARELVLSRSVEVTPQVAPGTPESMQFTEPFELKTRGNVQVEIEAPGLSSNWLGISGDLVNESTLEVVSFYQEVSEYSGVEDGERWSEGSLSSTEYLSAVDPGRYTLRLTHFYEPPGRGFTYQLRVRSDVPRILYLMLALLCLAVGPLVSAFVQTRFENARWRESNMVSDD